MTTPFYFLFAKFTSSIMKEREFCLLNGRSKNCGQGLKWSSSVIERWSVNCAGSFFLFSRMKQAPLWRTKEVIYYETNDIMYCYDYSGNSNGGGYCNILSAAKGENNYDYSSIDLCCIRHCVWLFRIWRRGRLSASSFYFRENYMFLYEKRLLIF